MTELHHGSISEISFTARKSDFTWVYKKIVSCPEVRGIKSTVTLEVYYVYGKWNMLEALENLEFLPYFYAM